MQARRVWEASPGWVGRYRVGLAGVGEGVWTWPEAATHRVTSGRLRATPGQAQRCCGRIGVWDLPIHDGERKRARNRKTGNETERERECVCVCHNWQQHEMGGGYGSAAGRFFSCTTPATSPTKKKVNKPRPGMEDIRWKPAKHG